MNPALLYYMGRPGAAQPVAGGALSESPVPEPIRQPLDEKDAAGQVAGFWMIPDGNTYAKLKIMDSYVLKGRRVDNLSDGGDAAPVWALATNYELLSQHFRWIKQLLMDNHGLFDGSMEQGKWNSMAARLINVVQQHRWGFYFEEEGEGYLSIPSRAAYKREFAKEMFDGDIKSPKSVTCRFAATQVHVYNGSNYADTPTAEELKKFLGYEGDAEANVGRIKPVYAKFEEFIEDYRDDTVRWDKLNPDTISKLSRPVYVEWPFMRSKDLQPVIAKFLREWLAFAGREGVEHAPLEAYSKEIQRAVQEGADSTGPEELNESSLREALSFAKLLKLTKKNGGYKRGAMVKVAGIWTTDVSVRGRVENARYVFSSPPLTEIEPSGAVIYRWKFKSRSDRSTTGLTHRGYLRLLPKKGGIMGFLKKLISGDGPWTGDCECWCSCPDFRYRSHYLLFRQGASHLPTGKNGDATNEPPLKTNPRNLVYMCKHLTLAGSVYLADPPKKFKEEVQKLQDMARARAKGVDYQPPEPEERPASDPDNPDRGVGMGGDSDDFAPEVAEDEDGTVELV